MRGIYLGNYVDWEANAQTELMVREWGFEESPEPFERTYRRMSNLDDMHENGIHDYLKFVKFGYGRGTDHACKDIRAGQDDARRGDRDGRRYDHVKPRRDLERWLDYVGMTEDEFDAIADAFRDPRVWAKDETASGSRTRSARSTRAAAPLRVTRLRETDIRPDELMAEQARRYAADVAWLLERRDRFVEVALPGLRRDRVTRRTGASTGSTTGAARAARRST